MPTGKRDMSKTHPAAPEGEPRDVSRRSSRRSSRRRSHRSSRRRSHRSHRRGSVQVGHRADAGRDVVALIVGYSAKDGARWLCARLSGGRGMRIKEIVQQKLAPEIQSMVAKGETATVEVAYGNGAPGSVMPGIEGDSVAAKEHLMSFASGGEFNTATVREYRHGKMEARILLIILPEATKIRTKTGTLPTPPGYNIPMIRDRVSLRQVSMVNATDAMMEASDKPVYVLYDMYDVQQVSPGKYKFVDVHTGSLRRDDSLSVSLLIQQALRDMGVSLAGRSDIGKLTPYFVTADGNPTLIGDDAAVKPCPQNVRIALLNARANDVYNEVGIPFPAKPTFVPRDTAGTSDVVGGVVAYGGMMRKAPRIRDAYRGVNLTKYRFCLHTSSTGSASGEISASGTIVGIPSMTAAAFCEQGAKGFAAICSDSSLAKKNRFILYVEDGESWTAVKETAKLSTFPANARFCWSAESDVAEASRKISRCVEGMKTTGNSLVILTTSSSASKGIMFSVQTDWTQSSALKGCIVTKAGTSLGVLQRAIRAVVDGAWEFAVTAPTQFPRDLRGVSDLTSKPHCVAGAVLQSQNLTSTKWLLLLSDEAYKDLVLYVSRTGRMWRKQNPPVEGAIVPIRRTSIRVLDIIGVGDSVNISASLFAVDQDSDLSSLVSVLQTRRGDGHVIDPSAVLVGLYATTSDKNDTPIAVVGTGVVNVDRAVKNSLDISTVPFKRLAQVQLGENHDNHVLIVMDAGAVEYYKRAFTVDGKIPRQIGTPMVYIPPEDFVQKVLDGTWDADSAKRCGDTVMMKVKVQLVSAAPGDNRPVLYDAFVPRSWSLRTLAESSAHACALAETEGVPNPPKLYGDKIDVSRITNRHNDVTFQRKEFDTQLQALMSWGKREADLIMYPQNTSQFINYYVFAPCSQLATITKSVTDEETKEEGQLSESKASGPDASTGSESGGGSGGGGGESGMCRKMSFVRLNDDQLKQTKDKFDATDADGVKTSTVRTELAFSTLEILQVARSTEAGLDDEVENYSAYVVGPSANNTGLSTIIWSGRGDSKMSVHQIGVLEQGAALVLVHDKYLPDSSNGLGDALSNFVIISARFRQENEDADIDAMTASTAEDVWYTAIENQPNLPVLVPKVLPNLATLTHIASTIQKGDNKPAFAFFAGCAPTNTKGWSWMSRLANAIKDYAASAFRSMFNSLSWTKITDDFRMTNVDFLVIVLDTSKDTTTNESQYTDVKTRWTVPADEAKKPLIESAPKKPNEGELVFSGDSR